MQHRADLLELIVTFVLLIIASLAVPHWLGSAAGTEPAQLDDAAAGTGGIEALLATMRQQWSGKSDIYNILVILACLYGATFLNSCPKRGGLVWPALRRWRGWRRLAGPDGYFRGDVRSEAGALDPHQLYIFCMFPHGAYSWNHFLTMTDACGMLSRVHSGPRRDIVASVLFRIPLLRELLLFLGCVDASASTARHNLRRGRSLLIYVGGEKEQLMTSPHRHRVYLRARKGFVKLALQHKAQLVPMYCYGENELYTPISWFMGAQVWMQKHLKIVVPMVLGRWGSPVPFRKRLVVEIGKPLPVPAVMDAVAGPSQAEIDALHAAFEAEMARLFERTKAEHGVPADVKLEIM